MTRRPTVRRRRHEAAAAVIYQSPRLPAISPSVAIGAQLDVLAVLRRAQDEGDAATMLRLAAGLAQLKILLTDSLRAAREAGQC